MVKLPRAVAVPMHVCMVIQVHTVFTVWEDEAIDRFFHFYFFMVQLVHLLKQIQKELRNEI